MRTLDQPDFNPNCLGLSCFLQGICVGTAFQGLGAWGPKWVGLQSVRGALTENPSFAQHCSTLHTCTSKSSTPEISYATRSLPCQRLVTRHSLDSMGTAGNATPAHEVPDQYHLQEVPAGSSPEAPALASGLLDHQGEDVLCLFAASIPLYPAASDPTAQISKVRV